MANRILKHRRGAANRGCLSVIIVVVLLAGGLYLTRERWLPWFNESFGRSSSPKSDQPGDPDMLVYVELEGFVYHRPGCNLPKKDVQEMTLAQARASSYKPCTKCNPPK